MRIAYIPPSPSSSSSASPQTASPAEVHAAYQCGLLAEAAARDFQKGASSLRKATDSALLADFVAAKVEQAERRRALAAERVGDPRGAAVGDGAVLQI